jgi:transposase InsO family protein
MRMAYDTNPKLPGIRAQAVRLLHDGWSTRKVARYLGYAQGTIVKWKQRASSSFPRVIETKSSRPKSSPNSLAQEIVARIIKTRIETKRCSEVVHEMLKAEGVNVSLSSVKRTLSQYGLLKKRSPWKRTRRYPPRPDILMAGDMVEMDTIHLVDKDGRRTYVYTAIDLYSRYGFAMLSEKADAYTSILFAKRAKRYFDFRIKVIQTDNGPEFGKFFSDFISRREMQHRHIHPRSPNENGHLERFNRTIQEEMPKHGLSILIAEDISAYLKHYNEKRMHMGIQYKTPRQLI